MAEKNPYDDLFSFKEDGAKAPVANARVAPADQKARDTDAAGILKNERDKAIKALGVLRGTQWYLHKKDADAHAANIQRAEADLAAIERELKRAGVEVTAPQDSAAPASAPASAPAPAASEASANSYAELFGGLKDEPPASAGVDPFMVASGAAGAYLGGRYAGKRMDRLALMRLEREYGLPPGSLSAMAPSDLARLVSTPPKPTAPAVVAPAGTPSAVVLPATPEGPLSAMEKWTNSQVGSESRLPSQVVSQFTSNVATDPSGAPQGILREAANTRKARELVPSSAMQVSPGGLPFVESTKERHANLIRQAENARLAAIDNAMSQPMEPVSPPKAGPPVAAPPGASNTPRRGSMAPLQSRAANVGVGAVAGLGAGAQAYNMASNAQQGKTPDWTEGLSLAGNLAPILSRSRAVGPVGALAQLPYLYKHWREIAAGLNMGDIMPYGTSTLTEENQPVFPTPGR